jgi:hypothetical protein
MLVGLKLALPKELLLKSRCGRSISANLGDGNAIAGWAETAIQTAGPCAKKQLMLSACVVHDQKCAGEVEVTKGNHWLAAALVSIGTKSKSISLNSGLPILDSRC